MEQSAAVYQNKTFEEAASTTFNNSGVGAKTENKASAQKGTAQDKDSKLLLTPKGKGQSSNVDFDAKKTDGSSDN